VKSIHHGKAGANVKMRGKLTQLLSCRCCQMQNWKWRERVREAKAEINDAASYLERQRNK
jgi:hypothetical protein